LDRGLKPPADDKLLSRAVNGILDFGSTNIDRPDGPGPVRTICNVMSANYALAPPPPPPPPPFLSGMERPVFVVLMHKSP